MSQFSRSWWGKKFIEAIEKLTDAGRLSRGRSYARGNKVKSFDIEGNLVTAQVRGSVNPYFGVYKEPLYLTTIEFKPLSKAKWSEAIALISSKASLISRLLLNEIPDNIEDTFHQLNLNLLPGSRKDFITSCSCPDYSNPCKHIAGVYYLVAAELDQDPFLLFELRGLSREDLLKELAKSPLGQALSAELQLEQEPPQPVESYYAPLELERISAKTTKLREFWQGAKRLPQTIEAPPDNPVSAIPVKTQGDFPAFWDRDNSFIEAMETLYEQVKTKGQF
ncbi:swim zinc finger family protein [Leptolyngbya sp. Heron Island J]|uniref:SWIM zinc finger family protein n=1 Tax=Leptolyngbya sp. Heron Island J TaxID=1385935 RepID=UPI0003B98C7F|nr:SWIM zinc finger family protein [Leptolyngbya sp. Heron Island J]ESA34584.1 swim zinc finger family protein [Leptolyngbya sp. Heron Island J]